MTRPTAFLTAAVPVAPLAPAACGATAEERAATGAMRGAVTGAVSGGPAGAVVGAALGATVDTVIGGAPEKGGRGDPAGAAGPPSPGR